ncbi:MAG: MerR family transcriptional regulator [Clostridia bacterium]|nr:MerR family transcriptional regulator [Clostridia bacterium]
MSQYSTGDIAKLCGISVRTVQFYDSKGLLKPAELSDGGRRLYCEDDLKKMNHILLLKALGLSLDSIMGIIESENSSKITLMLLEEQEKHVQEEIEKKKRQLSAIEIVKNNILSSAKVTVNSLSDIKKIMNGKKKLKNAYVKMGILGAIMGVAEIAAIVIWITKGNWIPFAAVMLLNIPIGILLLRIYYKNTAYICANCETKFKPGRKEFLFAAHTPRTRKLTCPSCGNKDYCVETYDE